MNAYRQQQLAAAALIDSGNYTAEQVAAVYGWIKPKHKPPERAAPERSGATGYNRTLTAPRKCGIIKAIKRCIRRWERKQEEKKMKKQYFIHIVNVLKDVDKWEQRTTKEGAENCANKALATYGEGTIAKIEDENELEIAVYC